MSDDRTRRFLSALKPALDFGDSDLHIDPPAILSLVREDADSAARTILLALRNAEQQPRMFRLAEALAVAYALAHSDDAFELTVEETRKVLGRTAARVSMAVGGKPVTVSLREYFTAVTEHDLNADEDSIILIGQGELDTCDTYAIAEFSPFSQPASRYQELVRLRGRIQLSFMVNDDPRAAVFIPEVRTFVAAIHADMAWFPYFLKLDQAMWALYFGCLVSSTPRHDGSWTFRADDPELAKVVVKAMIHVRMAARKLGDDATPVIEALTRPIPPQLLQEKLLDFEV